MDSYQVLSEDGVYNPYKLPFQKFAEIPQKYLSVGWAGTDHTGDLVEVCAYGATKELLNPSILDTDMHQIMLQASGLAEVRK